MNKKMLWKSDLGNGMFKNPILYTDYSDPDVIRVDDTFYMTTSSFNYVPGLPILISKDLVNWALVNYAINKIPYDDYEYPCHGRGIWAPSIRYHNNKFWIFVGMPDEGIFMTNTEDPLGKWSPLICVREGKGFIDPCPLWDDDGKSYVIHGYAKSRIGFKSKLGIFEITSDGRRCISEDKFIFDGTETQPTIEGPKFYKRDNLYYIFAPAGGVKTGWQTVLRSENIYGPYEEKIVMEQGSSNTNGPHQGGLVDTLSGEEWFIHFQDKGAYGRITHLQPVKWEDGWPIIGIENKKTGVGEPVEIYKKPNCNKDIIPHEPPTSDYFNKNELGLQWQWQGNYKENFYSINKDGLYLYNLNTANKEKQLIWNSSNILTQKITCPEFIVETKMNISAMKNGAKSGMTLIGGEYAAIEIECKDGKFNLLYLESKEENNKKIENILTIMPIALNKDMYFRVEFSNDQKGEFSFSFDGENWESINREFFPGNGMWSGARIGLFAIGDKLSNKDSYAKFSYINFVSKDDYLKAGNI